MWALEKGTFLAGALFLGLAAVACWWLGGLWGSFFCVLIGAAPWIAMLIRLLGARQCCNPHRHRPSWSLKRPRWLCRWLLSRGSPKTASRHRPSRKRSPKAPACHLDGAVVGEGTRMTITPQAARESRRRLTAKGLRGRGGGIIEENALDANPPSR